MALVRRVDHGYWERLAAECALELDPGRLNVFATHLGVSAASLRRLQIGWTGTSWSFPMRDGERQAVGIRLRAPSGAKYAVKGSQNALFIPQDADLSGCVFLPEGPTDTAALLDLRLSAVGRAAATAGTRPCIELVQSSRPNCVVVVAEHDPAGREGAMKLARALRPYARSVVTISPPLGVKDVREWRSRGAVAADLLDKVDLIRSGHVSEAA